MRRLFSHQAARAGTTDALTAEARGRFAGWPPGWPRRRGWRARSRPPCAASAEAEGKARRRRPAAARGADRADRLCRRSRRDGDPGARVAPRLHRRPGCGLEVALEPRRRGSQWCVNQVFRIAPQREVSTHLPSEQGCRIWLTSRARGKPPAGTATVSYGGKTSTIRSWRFVGPDVIDIRKPLRRHRGLHLRPRLPPRPPAVKARSPISTATRASSAIRGYPIDALAEHRRLPRDLLPADARRTAERPADEEVRPRHHQPHHGARADDAVLPRLPPRRAPDGDHGRRGRRDVGLLSRQHRTSTTPASADDLQPPPDRQDADDRRDGLQIFDRPAFVYPQQRPRPMPRTSCACAFGAGRGVQEPRLPQARWTASSSCTPTTSRTPRPRPCASPARRGQSVRLHRGRHRLLWGPAHGGANEAALKMLERDRHGRPHSRNSSQGAKDKNDPFRPDGLRPPGLQELRPRARR